MKRMLLSFMVMMVVAASGQQSGTPARIAIKNGKIVNGFLQGLENGKLTFQVNKSTRDIPAPIDKIKSLTFFPKKTQYDPIAVEQLFQTGDYAGVISLLDPVMKPYIDYMSISNNMLSAYTMLVTAHRKQKDFDQVRRAGEILRSSDIPDLVLQGQTYTIFAELSNVTTNGLVETNSLVKAEKMCNEMKSEAAKLYMQARIEQAKGNPKAGMKLVCKVIAEHGNNMDWMPSSELLSAYLYFDMGLTNSVLGTAGQVESIYAGSNISKDAEGLRVKVEAAVEKAKILAEKKKKEEAAARAAKKKAKAAKKK